MENLPNENVNNHQNSTPSNTKKPNKILTFFKIIVMVLNPFRNPSIPLPTLRDKPKKKKISKKKREISDKKKFLYALNEFYLVQQIKTTSVKRILVSFIVMLIMLPIAINETYAVVVGVGDWFSAICFLLIVIGSTLVIIVGFKRCARPFTHHAFKFLKDNNGDWRKNLHEFQAELESDDDPAFKFKNFLITKNYVMYDGTFVVRITNPDDIVCVYKTNVEGTILRFANPKRDCMVCFKDKTTWRIPFKYDKEELLNFKDFIKMRLPFCICDDDDRAIEKRWNRHPKELIDEVLKKREKSQHNPDEEYSNL
ncbi:MAG: hypothetical protein LBM38_05345 [Clostridiales bacterium]|jgi:hypothetical protein|nr:hypothetical protein [Clostridiales bacterium]